ncbi:MAG: glycosyltransferase family 4 protein [Thermoplasmata archaeon]
MRVVQICPYFHPHVGGVESHVKDISLELSRRGHEVTVVTSRHGSLPSRDEVVGVTVRRSKVLLTLFRAPITPSLDEELVGIPGDLYHSHSPPPVTSYFAAKASGRTGVPLVVTYHCDLEIPGPFGPLITGLYRRTFEAYTMRQASGVIATTRTYAATSRSVWRLDPAVIPNAVDVHRFNPKVLGEDVRERHGLETGEPLVLFVGRLVRHKGIEYLLQALRQVEARLLIVGSGDYVPELERLVSYLGLEGRVVFAGRISSEELPAYYAACDLFVLPSVSRLEAFGIAALEAMASAKPVVVSDVPGVREVIADGVEGLLAEPMNSEDLAAKIRVLLSDASRMKKMGRRGRRKVEDAFTVEKVVDRLEEFYTRVQSTTSRG